MALNTTGRLEGKVVSASKTEFTVKVQGKGHVHHDKEMTFPMSMWQGPGAVVGEVRDAEPYDEKDPRSKPRGNESVIVDFDLLAKLDADSKSAAAA